MTLAIDIGNTLAKLTVIDAGKVIEVRRTPEPSVEAVAGLFATYPIDRAVMIASRDGSALKRYVLAHVTENGERRTENATLNEKNKSEQSSVLRSPCSVLRFLEVAFDTPVPIKNRYATPSTQGADRLAGAVGAATIFPGEDVLVVDMGTAITFDLVSAAGELVGGNISPGAQMRLKALNHFTQGIPLYELGGEIETIATSSKSAVVSGVVNGIVYESDTYASELKALYPHLKVVFTGGDANFFAERVKSPIFVAPDLVALGLNRILEFNYALRVRPGS